MPRHDDGMRCSVRSLVVASLVATLVVPLSIAGLNVLDVGVPTATLPLGDAVPGSARLGSGPSEDAPWTWPTESHVVVRPWEAPESDYGPGHRGLDVAAAPGTPAVAVAAGTVTFAGPVGGRSVVAIDHGDGLVSTLDAVDASVAPGDRVDQGSLVGTTAAGHCTPSEPCLHIGARVDGRYVDPAAFLPRAAWPVLLPDGSGRTLDGGPRDARRTEAGRGRTGRRPSGPRNAAAAVGRMRPSVECGHPAYDDAGRTRSSGEHGRQDDGALEWEPAIRLSQPSAGTRASGAGVSCPVDLA